jgi:6,7-dimethyl-8-ribityllumazine synthase
VKIDKSKPVRKIKSGDKLRIAIVISKFNRAVTDKLLLGAKQALIENGVIDIKVFSVPGAFEIPIVTSRLCRENNVNKKVDGIITLGCIIKGETAHFEHIATSVSNTLNFLSTTQNIPIGFGVLTCYNEKQALDRCKVKPINADRNKGYEATMAVLDTIRILEKI